MRHLKSTELVDVFLYEEYFENRLGSPKNMKKKEEKKKMMRCKKINYKNC